MSSEVLEFGFETVINDPSIKKIYSFSDIHADMDTLLICLRDCAKVIIKKADHEYVYLPGQQYVPGQYDENANTLCHMDISEGDGTYTDDLNYVWNPEAIGVCVVIIGDILDGSRGERSYLKYSPDAKDPSKNVEMRPTNYRPQIEIKIYRFINRLMRQARSYGSRLIKLLGNHEIGNISGTSSLISNYSFREDSDKPNYYRGFDRQNVFQKDNLGFNLIMENGNGIIVIINGNVFVHGQLVDDYNLEYYEAINNFLNTPNEIHTNPKTSKPFAFNVLVGRPSRRGTLNDSDTSPLWVREFGSPDSIHWRLTHGDAEFNKYVQDLLKSSSGPAYDPKRSRLIIGHCPQNSLYLEDNPHVSIVNQSFYNYLPSTDGITEIAGPPTMMGPASTNKKLLFGISMECPKNKDNTDFFLYRVDVGASRGFDHLGEIMTIRDNHDCNQDIIKNHHIKECKDEASGQRYAEKIFFGTRVPQVLVFSGDSLQEVHIIRSTIKNTRINQPRPIYEEYVKGEPELNLSNGYYKKYLKYKNKYLLLKNKLKK